MNPAVVEEPGPQVLCPPGRREVIRGIAEEVIILGAAAGVVGQVPLAQCQQEPLVPPGKAAPGPVADRSASVPPCSKINWRLVIFDAARFGISAATSARPA